MGKNWLFATFACAHLAQEEPKETAAVAERPQESAKAVPRGRTGRSCRQNGQARHTPE